MSGHYGAMDTKQPWWQEFRHCWPGACGTNCYLLRNVNPVKNCLKLLTLTALVLAEYHFPNSNNQISEKISEKQVTKISVTWNVTVSSSSHLGKLDRAEVHLGKTEHCWEDSLNHCIFHWLQLLPTQLPTYTSLSPHQISNKVLLDAIKRWGGTCNGRLC